jgi:hypothetical protein
VTKGRLGTGQPQIRQNSGNLCSSVEKYQGEVIVQLVALITDLAHCAGARRTSRDRSRNGARVLRVLIWINFVDLIAHREHCFMMDELGHLIWHRKWGRCGTYTMLVAPFVLDRPRELARLWVPDQIIGSRSRPRLPRPAPMPTLPALAGSSSGGVGRVANAMLPVRCDE